MGAEDAPVELVFLWHHHQPDYRSAHEGCALLPWVRLHATKDYLDMARMLERHPNVRSTFNFVPSLLDQLDAAASGFPDALLDRMRRPLADLTPEDRAEISWRCVAAPRHAMERWPSYRRACEQRQRARSTNGGPAAVTDELLLELEVFFLLAWLDPMFHDLAEAREAIAAIGAFEVRHRDGLLALHDRLVAEVIPAYRELARRGQVELSASPYYHPILPLLVDVRSARRARPDLPMPVEPFAAPEDAARHVARAIARHAAAFGEPPRGMWPSEGSVSPEAVEIVARSGLRWMASDEGVLWSSLPPDGRKRGALYRPWRLETAGGEMALFFRDHELSDRIGFVYHHWGAEDAVSDFLGRVRRIGREREGPEPPVVSVILDGENCWEQYADDGGPFLEALYGALETAGDIVTRTPSQVLDAERPIEALPTLHSGSWINADFRIWIGHPEKNRAWDLLSRARRALVESGAKLATHPAAWESLDAAEGSDWFWWYGDDHYTPDKAIFDALFREHLMAAYEGASLPVPGWLRVPVATPRRRQDRDRTPVGFIHPIIDGRCTEFYEWHGAARVRLGAGGGSMHRDAGFARDLYFGFDLERLHLRVDFAGVDPPGADVTLAIDVLAPKPARLLVTGLIPGVRPVTWSSEDRRGEVAGAAAAIDTVLEVSVPFASLGLATGTDVEMLLALTRDGQPIETLPEDDLIRYRVPDATFESAMWSA